MKTIYYFQSSLKYCHIIIPQFYTKGKGHTPTQDFRKKSCPMEQVIKPRFQPQDIVAIPSKRKQWLEKKGNHSNLDIICPNVAL